MSWLKRLPAVAVLCGFASAVTGVAMLAGLPIALIVGGVALTAAGLLVDV